MECSLEVLLRTFCRMSLECTAQLALIDIAPMWLSSYQHPLLCDGMLGHYTRLCQQTTLASLNMTALRLAGGRDI